MAVITHGGKPHTPSRVTAAWRKSSHAVTAALRAAINPHRAALTNLTRIPLTAIGTGCVDYAAFHLGTGWGWLVTGVSLVLLEHVIADEE